MKPKRLKKEKKIETRGDDGIVRVGRKPWHVYRGAILNVFQRSSVVEVRSRGRMNNMTATSVISTVVQEYKDITASGRITFESWEAKDPETGKMKKNHAPSCTWILTRKSDRIRLRSESEE
jgi:hypothetical protein